jgi:hypothetical protein
MSEHTMEIKMSRFDNSPWGFRVHGGIDFGAPLRIQKVSTILAFLFVIKVLALTSRAHFCLYVLYTVAAHLIAEALIKTQHFFSKGHST